MSIRSQALGKLGLKTAEAEEVGKEPVLPITEQLPHARRIDETLMIAEKLPDFVIGLYEVQDPESGETIYVNAKGRRQTLDGREIPDPTPMDPPIGYKKQPSMFEQMRELIKSEKLRAAAEEAGVETFEEGDDFDVGDDFDPESPYEHNFDPPPTSPTPPTAAPSPSSSSSSAASSGAPPAPAGEGVVAPPREVAPSAPAAKT